jgi:flavin reductase (DIM6/NTAB) family NADH-FMN oxidoreductase RutF
MLSPLDTKLFRQAVGQFATGVSVIATEVDKEIHAMTANAFSSLSLNPLLVLFCVDKRAKMAEFIQKANGFSINFLRDDQQALSTYFAGGWKEPKPPSFRFVPWEGGPRLEGSAAAISCTMYNRLEGGDHWIVIGEVLAVHLGVEPRHPLVFHGGSYRTLSPEKEAAPELQEVKSDVRVFYDPWSEA